MKRMISGLTAILIAVTACGLPLRAGAESGGPITFNPNAPAGGDPDRIVLDLSEEKGVPLAFPSLGDLWGLSFQEIVRLYPDYVVDHRINSVWNESSFAPPDISFEADRYVLLGWNQYGGAMVLCEKDGKGSGCTVGYTSADIINRHRTLTGRLYPPYTEGTAAGLPALYEHLEAVALQDIPDTYYCDGYWFKIDFIKGERLEYLTTVETRSGMFDYVHSYTGRRSSTRSVFIRHGLIQIQIPISRCDIALLADRYGYTGKTVRPEVEIRYRGRLLTEGVDYEIVTDAADPGPARAVIRGMGYFCDEAVVNYTICETTIALDPIHPVVEGSYLNLQAIIWAAEDVIIRAGEPSAETVTWELKSSFTGAEWTKQETDHQELDYLLTRKVKPEKPGKYTISVTYDGVRASKEVIVEPKLSYSAGPLREDGTPLEGKNRDWISGYTDLRLCTAYDAENLPFLMEFLTETAEERVSVNEENMEIVRQAWQVFGGSSGEDEEGAEENPEASPILALALRVKPTLAENETEIRKTEGWFRVGTPARQRMDIPLRVTNGILADVGYRSERTGDERGWMAAESDLPAKNDSHLFYYTDRYFYQDSDRYQNDLAVMSLGLEMASFSEARSDAQYDQTLSPSVRAANLCGAYRELGFADYALYNYDQALTLSLDDIAFSFGIKYIASEETDDTLVTVVARGGGYGAEWASNFHIGNGGNHVGFETAASQMALSLMLDWLSQLSRDGRIVGEVKLWMVGFSRGAAVCSLAAEKVAAGHELLEVPIDAGNTYVYCFATPSGSRGSAGGGLRHVFNVISPNDLVPKLAPAAWGFRRPGRELILPAVTADEVKNAFLAYRGEELKVSNLQWMEEAIIDAMTAVYPTAESFTRQAERLIRSFEQSQFQRKNGSFVTGFILGLIGGIFADMGEAVMTDSFWETSKILFRTGWDILNAIEKAKKIVSGGFIAAVREGGFGTAVLEEFDQIGLDQIVEALVPADEMGLILTRMTNGLKSFAASAASGVFGQLSDDEIQGLPEFAVRQAHLPEHYLAWLETGGAASVTDDRAFALMNPLDREAIHQQVVQWLK